MDRGQTSVRVLIVEDPLIRRFAGGILKREGYLPIDADREESLRILRGGDSGVCLLVTNQPGGFLEFAGTLPLLYIASFPDPGLAARFRHCRMLRKPFSPDDLVSCAAELAPRD
jgi:hypothetical protein